MSETHNTRHGSRITHHASRIANPAQSKVALIGLVVITAVLAGLILAFGGPLAAAGIVIAGVAVLVVLQNIEVGFWGLIAVVCLLPFATLPFDIGLTPTFLDLAIAAVVGVWALRIVTGQQRTIITSPVTLPLLIFLLIALFAFIFGLSNGPLTPTLLRKFAELLLSLFFVIVVIDYCTTWERLERLVKVILLAAMGASILAIGLWLIPEDTANTILNYLVRLGYPGGWVIRYIEENPELIGTRNWYIGRPECVGRVVVDVGLFGGSAVGGETAVIQTLVHDHYRRYHISCPYFNLLAQRHGWAGVRTWLCCRHALSQIDTLHGRWWPFPFVVALCPRIHCALYGRGARRRSGHPNALWRIQRCADIDST